MLVEREKPICVVIDPAYLAMGSASQKCRNLFAMGEMLRPLAELCQSTGCTVLLVHHCKRSSKVGNPATLDDIAWSGFTEFSAQWLLLSRRKAFDPGTGRHEIWLGAGSRVGNHGLWELDVEEGAPAEVRTWKTSLRPVSSLETLTDERWVAAREDTNQRRRALKFDAQCQRTLELLVAYPDGRTARFIRDELGLSGDRMTRILDLLVEKGQVVKTIDDLDRRRPLVTYSRAEAMDLSQSAIKTRRVTPADPKVYRVGTGQFFERKTPQDLAVGTSPSVADVLRNLERLRAEIATEDPATSDAPISASPVGRETGRAATIEGEKARISSEAGASGAAPVVAAPERGDKA
jgi:hypothetical protein